MSNTVISVESVSKVYRLGEINTGMFYDDLKRWWAQKRGVYAPHEGVGGHNAGGNNEVLWALKDISFQLRQGEVLGIIGKNGSGKSTLLKILSRVTAPTYGEVKVKGKVASLLEVGTGFHPELTGRENIFLNSAILGMNRRDVQKKFDEIVDFSGVEKFIDTPVKHYSSGMYVRLAFSVASFLDSEVLILDEVLAVGDAAFQKKSLEKMEGLAKSGKTVLFVSHGLTSVTRLCDQGIYLEDGEILSLGATKDVVAHYLKKLHNIDDDRIASESGGNMPSYLDLRESDKRWDGYTKKIITWVSTHKLDGTPCVEFYTGDSMKIRVGYHVEGNLNAYFQINFLDYTGSRVMQLHSTHNKSSFILKLSNNGFIECVIHDLRLLTGNYIIMLQIDEYSKDKIQWLDCIGDTLHIKVGLGDYLEGVGLTQGQVVFAQQSDWSVVEGERL